MSKIVEDAYETVMIEEARLFWEDLLPPGWQLSGWTLKASAQAWTPDRRRVVQLDRELLEDFKKMRKP